MGVNDNDIDDDIDCPNEESHEKKYITYMPTKYEMVENSDNMPMDHFASCLWKPAVGPLGQMTIDGWNYYDFGNSDTELLSKAKNLKSRYTNFREYDEAINIYWDYMDSLIINYGSAKLLKKMIKLELVKDYIPKKPKLKNTKANREYIRYGMLPSMTCIDPKINPYDNDEVRAMIARMFPVTQDDLDEMDRKLSPEYEMTKEERKHYKEEAKWAKKAIAAVAVNPRKKSIYDNSKQSAVDSIMTYFNNISGKKKEKEEEPYLKYQYVPYNKMEQARLGDEYNPYERLPLTEILKYQEYEDEEFLPDELRLRPKEMWEKEHWQFGKNIGENGAYVKYEEVAKLEILTEMANEGFDVMKLYGKEMSKDTVRMLRTYAGRDATMTKKDMKHYKKRQKKEQKKLKRQAKEDSEILNVLLNNDGLNGLKKHIDKDGRIKPFHLEDMPNDYE